MIKLNLSILLLNAPFTLPLPKQNGVTVNWPRRNKQYDESIYSRGPSVFVSCWKC